MSLSELESEQLAEREKKIKSLQNKIKKLELKSKECEMYEKALLEYEGKYINMEQELFKAHEMARVKTKQKQIVVKENNELKDRVRKIQQRRIEKGKDTIIQQLQTQIKKQKQKYLKYSQELKDKESLKKKLKALEEDYLLAISERQKVERILKEERLNTRKATKVTDQTNTNSKDLEQLQFKLENKKKEAEYYHKKNQELEVKLEQYHHSTNQWSTQERNKQYREVIDQYEDHIASMASKLSSVHKVQMDMRKIEQQRNKYKENVVILEEQLTNRNKYIQILQEKLMKKDDSFNIHMKVKEFTQKNQKNEKQINNLTSIIKEKQISLLQLRENYLSMVQYTNKLGSMEIKLKDLESDLQKTRKELRCERQKVNIEEENVIKLQNVIKGKDIEHSQHKSEISKLNRTISQKMQKIEFQKMEIQRLEQQYKEKQTLSSKFAKCEKLNEQMEKKYQEEIDTSNELALRVMILSAEVERREEVEKVRQKQVFKQIQQMKKKNQGNERELQVINDKLLKLEGMLKKVIQETKGISNNVQENNKKLCEYDSWLKKTQQFLMKVEESQMKSYESINENFEKWIREKDEKLNELSKLDTSLEQDTSKQNKQ